VGAQQECDQLPHPCALQCLLPLLLLLLPVWTELCQQGLPSLPQANLAYSAAAAAAAAA
jgi:hypothetical protein